MIMVHSNLPFTSLLSVTLQHMGFGHTSLLSMSLAGTVIILVIIMIRAAALHRLPKATFTALWGIVMLRLLIPASIPGTYSIYSYAEQFMPATVSSYLSTILKAASDKHQQVPDSSSAQRESDFSSIQQKPDSFSALWEPGFSSIQQKPDSFSALQMNPFVQQQSNFSSALQMNPFVQQQSNLSPAQQTDSPSIQVQNSAQQTYPSAVKTQNSQQQTTAAGQTPDRGRKDPPIRQILWLVGMIGCTLFFTVTYIRSLRIFSMSLPIDNRYTRTWLETHISKRPISIRQSGFIAAPLTYGMLHPVILMPKGIDWDNTEQLQYIFAHEYVHIRRFDILYKLLLMVSCCIHWFNPFVWVMYLLANHDLELSCDEAVVQHFGEMSRSAYACALIRMEETKSGFAPLCSRFSKNTAEERITAIMKTKKNTIYKTATACILFTSVIFVSAISSDTAKSATAASETGHMNEKNSVLDSNDTEVSQRNALSVSKSRDADASQGSTSSMADINSAITDCRKLSPIPDTDFTDSEYQKLIDLCFYDLRSMTVAEYRKKIWDIIDTEEYINLLNRFSTDEKLYDLKDSNPTAGFLFYIFEPLTAEKWRSANSGGYALRTCDHAADDAVLEYSTRLTIKNAKKLTVGEYSDTHIRIQNAVEEFLMEIPLDKLQDETWMKSAIQSQIPHFENDFCPKTMSVKVTDWYYSPLFVYEEEQTPSLPEPSKQPAESPDDKNKEIIICPAREPIKMRNFPNGRKQDYQAVLALKTAGYKDRTIEDFNAALLECVNSIDQEYLEGIYEDIRWDDYKVTLSESEKSFLQTTYLYSNLENAEKIKSMHKNAPEEPICFNTDLGTKCVDNRVNDSWCSFWYQMYYKIKDQSSLTVRERDQTIRKFQNEMNRFWEETSLKDLLGMSKKDVIAYMKKTASKHSSEHIVVIINKDHVQFEHDRDRDYYN